MNSDFTTVTLTLNPALDLSTAVARVEPAHKLRCEPPRFDPGGGGINVGRVIRRLGGSALAVYPEGGSTGQRLSVLLEAEGTPTRPSRIAGETRESFTVLDQSDAREYRFVLPGPELSSGELDACLEAAISAASPRGFVVVSGSLPPGVGPDCFTDLARRARVGGLRLVVDTSGPSLAAALEAGVYLAKPNLRELTDLMGSSLPDTASRVQACRDLIARGGSSAIALSLGAEGALLVTGDGAWSSPGLPVEPVSSVGAGDSFLGGFLWALGRDLGLVDGFRHAMASGAAALLSPGTELCRRADVFRLLEQVSVTPVEASA
ncbi:MAG: 1-phosphofructokinase family hexose kinase [Brevundimonas sp.]|nr:1-phosphofructokinase family hexose kinase [Brevundimonas sp.]